MVQSVNVVTGCYTSFVNCDNGDIVDQVDFYRARQLCFLLNRVFVCNKNCCQLVFCQLYGTF